MLYIDITRLYNSTESGKLTGVDKVTIAYLANLGKNSCAVIRYPKYWLFLPYGLSQALFQALLKGKRKKIAHNQWGRKLNAIRFAQPQKGEKNYLLHTSHSGLEKPDFIDFMNKYQLKGIYFLHDLIPIDYPEYCRDGEKQKHQVRLQTMSQGELVICNSQYTLSRWQDYCGKNGLELPQSIFAHLAPDMTWQKKIDIAGSLFELILPSQPYFLVIGTIEARKNHLLLLNVWRALFQNLKEHCPKLVIVGKRGWECEQVVDILDRSDTLKQVVLEFNNCSDEDLNYLMHHCQALLFPSFEEGYGLPLLEAFYSHIPVIASDIPAFREINFDNIGCLLSPIDALAWKDKIIDYCDSKHSERLEQIKKMSNIQNNLPTWERHFTRIFPYIMIS